MEESEVELYVSDPLRLRWLSDSLLWSHCRLIFSPRSVDEYERGGEKRPDPKLTQDLLSTDYWAGSLGRGFISSCSLLRLFSGAPLGIFAVWSGGIGIIGALLGGFLVACLVLL